MRADPPNVDEVVAFIQLQGGAGTLPTSLNRDLRPTPRTLSPIVSEVWRGIVSFANGDGWNVKVQGASDRLVSGNPPRIQWRIRRGAPVTQSTIRGLFLLLAQDLFIQESHRLAICALRDSTGKADCSVMFVRDDPRERFCTRQHADLDRKRKSRKALNSGQ
jgi:hypothetical protein